MAAIPNRYPPTGLNDTIPYASTDSCAADAAPVVEVSSALRPWSLALGDLWARREIVGYLTWRDIRARYHQTVLGVCWTLVQPLAATLVYAVVFGRMVRIQSDGAPYPLWVMAGVLSWQFIASSIQRASTSLVANSAMIKKVYFPRLAIPMAAVATSLVEFAAACVILVGMMLHYGVMPSFALVLLPIMVLLGGAIGLGVGLLLASVNCRFRDVAQGIGFLMQMWMFLTPILYPLTMVPERWRAVIRLNPMTGVISGFRAALLGLPVDGAALAWSVVAGTVLLVVGGATFRRAERGAADVL